jgi:hypothetical protein
MEERIFWFLLSEEAAEDMDGGANLLISSKRGGGLLLLPPRPEATRPRAEGGGARSHCRFPFDSRFVRSLAVPCARLVMMVCFLSLGRSSASLCATRGCPQDRPRRRDVHVIRRARPAVLSSFLARLLPRSSSFLRWFLAVALGDASVASPAT